MNHHIQSRKLMGLIGTLVLLAVLAAACAPAAPEGAQEDATQAPAAQEDATEAPAAQEGATLAIEHFSVIEGTTWSGAHDRAGKRIAEKSENVDYVYREEVGPDLTVPYAEELISDGADIVIGNAEFMGMPLIDIADKYPDVY
ncbi:MAG: hypothetical protein WBD62_16050, partial [Anaerolineales bacterium]